VPILKPQWIEGEREDGSICRNTSKVSRILLDTPVVIGYIFFVVKQY